MERRWLILAALTLARTALGFQFQSVPAVAPELTSELGMSYAALGTLVGLYLLPGVVFALPGGWLGRRFGEKRVVLLGLGLMVLGGAMLGLFEDRTAITAGRVLSGTGAVLLNVLLTKMTADWFAEREIVTAMGIFLVSWPLGIALAMVLLPTLAEAFGWPTAMLAGAAAAAACCALVGLVYQPPPVAGAATPAEQPRMLLGGWEAVLAISAGLVWTFYNVGFITVLAFGAEYLTARGESAIAAAGTVSIVSWLIIPSVAGGGWIAERVGRPDRTMAASFVAVALLLWSVPLLGSSALPFIAVGLLFGPAAPLIMVLPVEAVRAENRAVGMGVYYTCYYLGMAVLPPVAGLTHDLTGEPAAPLWFAGAMLLVALATLAAFRALQRRAALPLAS